MQVLTSQRLRDGVVVFFTDAGDWSESIDEARVFDKGKPDSLLDHARPDEGHNLITGSYLIDVERRGDRVVPLRTRERIRSLGPTVRPDLQRPGATSL